MFITNNPTWFHLYRKENLVKLYFIFLSLFSAPIAKTSHIFAGIFFILLKKGPRPNLKGFQYQIWSSAKRSEKLLSSKTIFSPFCKLIALILDQNFVKGFRVPKIVKQIKF